MISRLTAACWLLLAVVSPLAAQDWRTNVLVIVTDDAGYADFGCFGGTEIPTPHIDSLARDGVKFTQAYVSASVCAPSRAGLLTGRYQQRFGHEFNGPSQPQPGFMQEDMGLAPAEVTIGEAFRREGYRTFAAGKWHMGLQPQFHPRKQGFDEFYGFLGGSRSYFPIEKNVSAGRQMHLNEFAVPESSITYLTDNLADATVEFISETFPYPWFICLAFNAVHTPMHAKDEDLQQFGEIESKPRRSYAAMTKSLDDAVGRVLAELKEQGIEQNTLVILINDNGGATNNSSDNGIYRGMKGSKWEGGIRVPMLMRWPGHLPAGTTYDRPVSALDILPTALAAIEARETTYPENLDGVNLLPYLSGEKDGRPHETLFWRRGVAAAIRKGPWKLIRIDGKPVALVNIEEDPRERSNRLTDRPELVKGLLGDLKQWESELSSPKWVEADRWRQNQIKKHQWDVQTREQERKYP
jgi:arylsulfatase A-like enzyme